MLGGTNIVPGRRPALLTILCFPPPVQSLDWETFEQYCTWQLFLAHNIPLETIIPILQHLKYKGELSPWRDHLTTRKALRCWS